MKDKELSLIIKRFANPLFLLHALGYWSGVFLKKSIKKVSWFPPARKFIYPKYLRKSISGSSNLVYEKDYLKNMVRVEQIETINHESKKQQFDLPNWFQEFDDHEKMLFLHRWGWLLMDAADNPSTRIKDYGIAAIKDWCESVYDKKDHPAWESYSISERISNALMFFYSLRNYPASDTEGIEFIEKKLIEMAAYLLDRLEFNFDLTNNHVLNNARALYMLGMFSSCTEIAETGRQIFINETPRMITSQGFLREGSSNYHLLLLRTYLEVLWTAESKRDDSFADILKPVVESMVKAARFFRVDKNDGSFDIPLIGDVSPDFPGGWFSDICRSRLALELYDPFDDEPDYKSGWNRIWANDN